MPTFWEDAPDAWDDFHIEGIDNLGLATVDVKKSHEIDPKKTPGSVGTTLTHTGYELAQVNITIRMWQQSHLDAYQALVAKLKPVAGVTPDPIDCYHPALDVLGITKLYFAMWTPPKPSAVRGVFEVTLVAQEYDPTKKGKAENPKASTDFVNEPQTGGRGGTSFGQTKPKPKPSENPKPK